MAYLKYIGAGSFLPDVPARDLTKEEAEYHGEGRLLSSGLYELVRKPTPKPDEEKPKKRGNDS